MNNVNEPVVGEEAKVKGGIGERKLYHALNAELNLMTCEGIQFEKDKEAIDVYLRDEVEPKTVKFASHLEKVSYLVENDYYETQVFGRYSDEFISKVYDHAYGLNHKFESFLGAFKFYTSYALRTFDGTKWLESFTDRVVAVALTLADGDEQVCLDLVDEMLSKRFQPATPTFLNAGKKQRGEFVSCQLTRIEDNMESIVKGISTALQLSKRGGGVALMLSNLREAGAPIKKIENQSSGVIPVMKILEDSFSYANQLGARQGAGAVYLHAHHPDILAFLDTKRENADEKIRIKSLSLGIVVPDITFQLAKENKDMHLFSPYDVMNEYGIPLSDIGVSDRYDELVANPNIRKKTISARKFFKTVAELQFESGYPYFVFEDTVNRANPIDGYINMSNLCNEIMQVNTPSTFKANGEYDVVGKDISCNLGSMNIWAAMRSPSFADTVETSIRALTAVSDITNLEITPSIARGNRASHSIGLGQMNLHGYLASEGIEYGSEEAVDFTNMYFYAVTYNAIAASNKIATERGETFEGFEKSAYADGTYFDKYVNKTWEPATEKVAKIFADANIHLPTQDDWVELREKVKKHGMYNAYLQAVPPTGSISYLNNSTASVHPVASKIEIRKEGKIGRVYYPAPHMTQDNMHLYADSYEIGYEKIIDTYAAAQQHIDQGMSLTLFFRDTATTRDLNKAQIYAWRKGIKGLYYIRLRQPALEGTEIETCVSCQL